MIETKAVGDWHLPNADRVELVLYTKVLWDPLAKSWLYNFQIFLKDGGKIEGMGYGTVRVWCAAKSIDCLEQEEVKANG